MKKVLSILSLTVVAIILGTSLNGCEGDDVPSDNTSAIINLRGCIECDNYYIFDIFSIDGVTYTVADREMLDDALSNGEDLTKYCTSKVTNMEDMFSGAESFNQDIGNWDVSNVTIMYSMFESAESFNQDIGNWDVSNVTYMDYMFRNASSFNQDLTQWCVSNMDSKPDAFSENSGLTPENHPIWGTCPE